MFVHFKFSCRRRGNVCCLLFIVHCKATPRLMCPYVNTPSFPFFYTYPPLLSIITIPNPPLLLLNPSSHLLPCTRLHDQLLVLFFVPSLFCFHTFRLFFSSDNNQTEFLVPRPCSPTLPHCYSPRNMSRRDNRRGARSLHCRGYDISRIGERDLRHLFASFGKVIDVYLPKDHYTKELRGFAYIQFERDSDADAARLKLDRTDIFHDNHVVNIMWAAGDRKTPDDMRRLDIERDNPYARRERERQRRGDPDRRYDRDHDFDRRPRYRDDRPRSGFGGGGGRRYSRSPPPMSRRGAYDRHPADGDGPPPSRYDRYDHDDRHDRRDRYDDYRRSISPPPSRKRARDPSLDRQLSPTDSTRRDDALRRDYRPRSRSRSRSPVRRRTSGRGGYRSDEERDHRDHRERDHRDRDDRDRDVDYPPAVKPDGDDRRYPPRPKSDEEDRPYVSRGKNDDDFDNRFPPRASKPDDDERRFPARVNGEDDNEDISYGGRVKVVLD